MVQVKQNIFFNDLVVEVKDTDYFINITTELGNIEPFSFITASNGQEIFTVSLRRGKYGYFIEMNNVTYFIRFKDFNITIDKLVQYAKEGYDSFKHYIQMFLSKGKVIKSTK